MTKKLRQLKNKKGFTLVELIVVLIILAVLAAILLPSLTRYIDDARNQVAVSEMRGLIQAAQVKVSKAYANSNSYTTYAKSKVPADANGKPNPTPKTLYEGELFDYAELPYTPSGDGKPIFCFKLDGIETGGSGAVNDNLVVSAIYQKDTDLFVGYLRTPGGAGLQNEQYVIYNDLAKAKAGVGIADTTKAPYA